MYLIGGLPKDQLTDAIADLIAHIPREVIYFRSSSIPVRIIHAQFSNLKALRFDGVLLIAIVPKQTLGGDERDLLSRRAATGNLPHALRIYGSTPVHPELVESVKGTVREFRAEQISSLCPFRRLRHISNIRFFRSRLEFMLTDGYPLDFSPTLCSR